MLMRLVFTNVVAAFYPLLVDFCVGVMLCKKTIQFTDIYWGLPQAILEIVLSNQYNYMMLRVLTTALLRFHMVPYCLFLENSR